MKRYARWPWILGLLTVLLTTLGCSDNFVAFNARTSLSQFVMGVIADSLNRSLGL